MKHAVKHLRFPEAAIEAVATFPQVAGEMLGADTMMDTTDVLPLMLAIKVWTQGKTFGASFPEPGTRDLLSYEMLVATVPAVRNIEAIWGK